MRDETQLGPNKDITPILKGWDFRPNEIIVRRIPGLDGKPKIQMRIDLGLIQMEATGRPDGKRPHGKESYLHYYLAKLEQYRRRHGSDEGFVLSEEDCMNLKNEAIQYYHRYVSLFHLGDYAGVARDTERNLKVLELVRDYAEDEELVWMFDQYRPYILMMNARARGEICLRRRDFDGALKIVEQTMRQIAQFYREYNAEEAGEHSPEIDFLEEWAEDIRDQRPMSVQEKLEEQLRQAVAEENYERAAILRDELLRLQKQTPRDKREHSEL